jgi:uncharacterized protein DUF4389
MTGQHDPVQVNAELEPGLSRGLWLVKWLLLIPHLILLAFLWVAFVVVAILAFFAILVTGRYPRALFEFNLGVLRWSWRVQYYGYAALGTDRYPPFSLGPEPDYPATLDIAYPEHLSRGLVLVKWVLAIPHYIVVGLFAGGGLWLGGRTGDSGFNWAAGGLVGILVLVAGLVLLFTGGYPKPVFDFVLGMDRWVLRVAAYVALMTDRYPPFRLDTGGVEPGAPEPTAIADHPAPPARSGWTPGRIVAVVCGALLALTAAGLLSGSAALVWADQTQRDDAGFLSTSAISVHGPGYAVVTDRISVQGNDIATPPASAVVGQVRIVVTPDDPAAGVFVGIAPAARVDAYLSGAAITTVRDFDTAGSTFVNRRGDPVAADPGAAAIWEASAQGNGSQTLTWKPTSGDWRVVVMNADASPGVAVHASAGVEAPGLVWIAVGIGVLGLLLLAAGTTLIIVPVHRAGGHTATGPPAAEQPVPTA